MKQSTPVFIDTHIAIWLATDDKKKISVDTIAVIEASELFISPMVVLELQYLYEIKRIPLSPEDMLKEFKKNLKLEISQSSFSEVCANACKIGWTRDSFDRLIVAEADLYKAKLVTADEKILQNYKRAVW